MHEGMIKITVMDLRLTTIVATFLPECFLVGRDEVSVPKDEVALENE